MEYRRTFENGAADALLRKEEDDEPTTLSVISIHPLGKFWMKWYNIARKTLSYRIFCKGLVKMKEGVNPIFSFKEGCLYYKDRLYICNNQAVKGYFICYIAAPWEGILGLDNTLHKVFKEIY